MIYDCVNEETDAQEVNCFQFPLLNSNKAKTQTYDPSCREVMLKNMTESTKTTMSKFGKQEYRLEFTDRLS